MLAIHALIFLTSIMSSENQKAYAFYDPETEQLMLFDGNNMILANLPVYTRIGDHMEQVTEFIPSQVEARPTRICNQHAADHEYYSEQVDATSQPTQYNQPDVIPTPVQPAYCNQHDLVQADYHAYYDQSDAIQAPVQVDSYNQGDLQPTFYGHQEVHPAYASHQEVHPAYASHQEVYPAYASHQEVYPAYASQQEVYPAYASQHDYPQAQPVYWNQANQEPETQYTPTPTIMEVPITSNTNDQIQDFMIVTSYNLPPNTEGVVASVDPVTSAKIVGHQYENVMYSDGTKPDMQHMRMTSNQESSAATVPKEKLVAGAIVSQSAKSDDKKTSQTMKPASNETKKDRYKPKDAEEEDEEENGIHGSCLKMFILLSVFYAFI